MRILYSKCPSVINISTISINIVNISAMSKSLNYACYKCMLLVRVL
jgi:hypothetical protein